MKEKETIEMKPAENKCWQNKRGHKFVHTNGRIGLPIYIEDTEKARTQFANNYTEVNI